jgi:hypothetical protein
MDAGCVKHFSCHAIAGGTLRAGAAGCDVTKRRQQSV